MAYIIAWDKMKRTGSLGWKKKTKQKPIQNTKVKKEGLSFFGDIKRKVNPKSAYLVSLEAGKRRHTPEKEWLLNKETGEFCAPLLERLPNVTPRVCVYPL